MHFQSDISSRSDKVWTRQELERWLSEHFKGAALVLPDDSFYGQCKNKDDLEELCERIRKQLKIRTRPTYTLSDSIKAPGLCTVRERKVIITLPIRCVDKPLLVGAYTSHLLSHALLLLQRKQQLDYQENERLADSASLQAGLGLVVVNGSDYGWRTLFSKKTHERSAALGYFSVSQFLTKLKLFLQDREIEDSIVNVHIAPRLRYRLTATGKTRKKVPEKIKHAHKLHRRSIINFLCVCVLLIVTPITSLLVLVGNPLAFDEKLASLRSNATNLEQSYQQCLDRYERLQESLPKEQISSDRLLSLEQSRCQSLKNRYNAASKSYNNYLKAQR